MEKGYCIFYIFWCNSQGYTPLSTGLGDAFDIYPSISEYSGQFLEYSWMSSEVVPDTIYHAKVILDTNIIFISDFTMKESHGFAFLEFCHILIGGQSDFRLRWGDAVYGDMLFGEYLGQSREESGSWHTKSWDGDSRDMAPSIDEEYLWFSWSISGYDTRRSILHKRIVDVNGDISFW